MAHSFILASLPGFGFWASLFFFRVANRSTD